MVVRCSNDLSFFALPDPCISARLLGCGSEPRVPAEGSAGQDLEQVVWRHEPWGTWRMLPVVLHTRCAANDKYNTGTSKTCKLHCKCSLSNIPHPRESRNRLVKLRCSQHQNQDCGSAPVRGGFRLFHQLRSYFAPTYHTQHVGPGAGSFRVA